jgi:4-hydroxybenzoate polyprenyltransferase
LYGALYTLNDIFDIESDKKHPKKRNRPLPSGKISKKSAYVFALCCILLSAVSGYILFGKKVLLVYVLFALVNQFYTRIAKKIPYLEIAANSITYPMRFFLGVILVSSKTPWLVLLVIFFLACALSSLRRIVELGQEGFLARAVLKYYKPWNLTILQIVFFFLIIFVWVLNYPEYTVLYAVIVAFYFVFVFGYYFSKSLKRFYHWVWLN